MSHFKSLAPLALAVALSLLIAGCGAVGKGMRSVGGWVGLGDGEPEQAAPASGDKAATPEAAPTPTPTPTPAPAPTVPELTLPPTPTAPFEDEEHKPSAAVPPPAPSRPQVYEVIVPEGAYTFVPRELTIYEGDTVVWKNESGLVHLFATIPGSDPSGHMEIEPSDLLVNADLSHTFLAAGNYPYFCFIHNRMTGKVVVLPR